LGFIVFEFSINKDSFLFKTKSRGATLMVEDGPTKAALPTPITVITEPE
jgi:hypothetical protein